MDAANITLSGYLGISKAAKLIAEVRGLDDTNMALNQSPAEGALRNKGRRG